ncbi:MAG: hypothetical protein HZA61_17235 [Candidatus Eisenbacteria bacterium]|uniref:Uncharacterized protein n=1 Tax=Eiseniibacteriota bacterium TaxID=2212470 RepID=A0A933SJY1_UNCEI|nr:hypothetical protein [Candidatus Eisenbacteria bacterium]
MSSTLPSLTQAPATGFAALLQPRVVLRATLLAIALLYVATTLRAVTGGVRPAVSHDDRPVVLQDR